VVKSNVLSGIFQLDNTVMISSSREVVFNFSSNIIDASWDGIFYRIVGSNDFYPFVQQVNNFKFVSLVTNPSANSQLIKGVYRHDADSVEDWYVQDGPNVAIYTLQPGTTVIPASTKPFVLAQNNFDVNEVQTDGVSFVTTGNSLQLEKVPFGSITTFPNAYVFLMTRNIHDDFGFVGWSISTTDTASWNTPQQLPPPARFEKYPKANMTVNFKQRVKATTTRLLIAFRNGGSKDISSATATIVGFPINFDTTIFTVYPRGACKPANSNDGPSTPGSFDAIMCQVGRIAARSNVKVRVIIPSKITKNLEITDVSGPNVGSVQTMSFYKNR